MDGAVSAGGDEIAKDAAQETRKLRRAHLARGHGEGAVARRAEPGDMAVDRHVVGWVREHHLRRLIREQMLEVGALARVAAEDPVPADGPEIPGARDDWRVRVWLRHRFRRSPVAGRSVLPGDAEDSVDVGGLKAGQLDVEIDLRVGQELQLDGQQFTSPACSASRLSARM